MNSEIFMRWVQGYPIPLFNILFPGKMMVFILDNTPHHHLQGIPSLDNTSKTATIDLIKDHGVTYINLLLTDNCRTLLKDADQQFIHGDHLHVRFEEKQIRQMQAKSNLLRMPTLYEVKIFFVIWLQANKPDVLCCQVEAYPKDHLGQYSILWILPYFPGLQTIELLRAAGKNYAAQKYFTG